MRAFDIFRRILWVKSVTGDAGVCSYSDDDVGSRARVPRRRGDRFELHASEDDALTLGDPAVGDIVVLTQHDQVTHLVEVTGSSVEPRPRSTMRPGTRDRRFSVQREVELLVLRKLEDAPLIDDAFGFDPHAKGGEVLAIAELPAFEARHDPLWLVQRRIARRMLDEINLGYADALRRRLRRR